MSSAGAGWVYRRSDSLSGWQDDTWGHHGWNNSRPLDNEGPALGDLADAELLARAVVGQGSSSGVMVALKGPKLNLSWCATSASTQARGKPRGAAEAAASRSRAWGRSQ